MTDEEEYLVSLMALPPKKQLAFGLLVLERMLPSLTAFSKETGFNDSCYLRAREAAWKALQNGAVDQALSQSCIESAPDTEEFLHRLTSYALNAALATAEIAEFTMDGCTDHIAKVTTLAQDSVYLYLSSVESSVISSPEEERRIAGHPLTQLELSREEEDIRFVARLPDSLDSHAVSTLRGRAATQAPLLPLAGS